MLPPQDPDDIAVVLFTSGSEARSKGVAVSHAAMLAGMAQLRAVIDRYVPSARSLLDVACGTGKHLEHLQHHYRVAGVDISPAMLDVARRRLPGVPLHVGDMVDFELGRTFDVVTCLESLEFTSDPKQIVRELVRVLLLDAVVALEAEALAVLGLQVGIGRRLATGPAYELRLRFA